MRRADIPADSGLVVLMDSDEAGLCLLDDPAHRSLLMFNHIEYDSTSPSAEYHRDAAAGTPIAPTRNSLPRDAPARQPEQRCRRLAHRMFGNSIGRASCREIGCPCV